MRLETKRTVDFREWYEGLDMTTKRMVDARVKRFVETGQMGQHRRIGMITEFKWKNGLRVYFAVKKPNLILLLGGNKNGQDKDIFRAKNLFQNLP